MTKKGRAPESVAHIHVFSSKICGHIFLMREFIRINASIVSQGLRWMVYMKIMKEKLYDTVQIKKHFLTLQQCRGSKHPHLPGQQ